MDWEQAPDERTLRTLDWINDACEAALGDADRTDGKVSYRALMSPKCVEIRRRPRRVFGVRLTARRQLITRRWPISVLITDEWVLIGTQRRFSRLTKVYKFRTADLSDLPEGQPARVSLEFALQDEVNFVTGILKGVTATRAPA